MVAMETIDLGGHGVRGHGARGALGDPRGSTRGGHAAGACNHTLVTRVNTYTLWGMYAGVWGGIDEEEGWRD